MLIGKFAEKFNVKTDTIRYYMELGLLIPKKKNHYYEFDATCVEDMKWITELKSYYFTLQEINNILAIKRVTSLSNKEGVGFLIQMLEEKKRSLTVEVEHTNQAINAISNKITEINNEQYGELETTGMAFDFISLLYCPTCQEALELQNVNTKGQRIITGDLSCSVCDYSAKIQEGIVITEHLNKDSFNPFYIYDIEMLKTVQSSFISISEKAGLYIKEQLLKQPLKNKIIVETNVETYVFLNKYAADLDPEARYIFTGSTLSMLKMLKTKIDQTQPDLHVLYVLNSGLNLPFKHGSIDYLIDSYSFNEYSLFHRTLPMKQLSPYLHTNSLIVGCYFQYEEKAKTLLKLKALHPNGHPDNLKINYMMENLQLGNFHMSDKEKVGQTTDPGKYIKYHVPGEAAKFYNYTALRS
ncbi:MerR family transcriptional regulator [Virgibacillus sp. W0181]|uniref:MerR family transcriptional regulator n=1 Tax=Virgibacillus sp. W0181 TaxID=3391581 RepID=UPI003F451A55